MFFNIALYGSEDVKKNLEWGKNIIEKVMQNSDLEYYIVDFDNHQTFKNYDVFLDNVKLKLVDIVSLYISEDTKQCSFSLLLENNSIYLRVNENSINESIYNLIIESLTLINIKYGYIYVTDNEMYAKSYEGGHNFINIYDYEDSSLWEDAQYEEDDSFLTSKLRLVYKKNFINNFHLSINIDNRTLNQLIVDEKFGSLLQLSKDLYLWQVAEEQLESVNELLGKNKILISWIQPQTQIFKPKKKIP